jgi:dGTPase
MSVRAPYAADPALSRGRLHPEALGELRGPRTAFQRDRDRIVHSTGFRRLRHKTQVFVAPDGDHFRVRLTHSLEVAQIARTLARALGLDEDLTEALALAHDIGHPPFGHAGEDALKACMVAAGGFDHNGQTLRILTRLEATYPVWDGLNLTWDMLEGLAKHNGPVTNPGWALHDADAGWPLELGSYPSVEAQVAAIADDIAYDNHDIDDGLRSGVLDKSALLALPFVASRWDVVKARHPDASERRLLRELVRQQIGAMVNDVLVETRARIARLKPQRIDDVRHAGVPMVGFSADMSADERALKRFMYANLYHHPRQVEVATIAKTVVTGLFKAYVDDPRRMPANWHTTLPANEPGRTRHICDFIAGMTDRYAAARYRDHVGPINLPEGF